MADLGQALVDGYVDNGFAEHDGDSAMTGVDGMGRIELVESTQDGKLEVYASGELVDTLDYDNPTFAEELSKIVAEELNF